MKKIKIIIFITIITVIAIMLTPAKAGAQVSTQEGRLETKVSATVGQFTLTVSGFISPFASVVLSTTNKVFLASTVANAQGNFSFSSISIQEGFAGFCLIAVDFKQLGESETCFTFPPAQDSITMTGIFLSPTLGLSRTEIDTSSTASAFGYTMPGANITLYITKTQTLRTIADPNGYYEFKMENLPAGQYSLYSFAEDKGKQSVIPTKQIQLRVLSYTQKTGRTIQNLLDRIVNLITTMWYVPILVAILLIILIIILILKLWPGLGDILPRFGGGEPKESKDHKLHHWWFVGY